MDGQTKVCGDCRTAKPVTEFGKDRGRRDGLNRRCRACDNKRAADYYVRNRERKLDYARRNLAHRTRSQVEGYRKTRAAALAIYGGVCAVDICDETSGLQFDHVNGDGGAHREREDHRSMLWRIVRTGAPLTDVDLQLLCRPHHNVKSAAERRARYLARLAVRTAKRCKDCHVDKPLAEYPRDRSASDGLDSRCRHCTSARNRRVTIAA